MDGYFENLVFKGEGVGYVGAITALIIGLSIKLKN